MNYELWTGNNELWTGNYELWTGNYELGTEKYEPWTLNSELWTYFHIQLWINVPQYPNEKYNRFCKIIDMSLTTYSETY